MTSSNDQETVHVLNAWHWPQAQQVLRVVQAVGFAATLQKDPPAIIFVSPTPLSLEATNAMWWGIDHLPRRADRGQTVPAEPLTIAVLVRRYRIWQRGMAIVARLDATILPDAARAAFMALLTAERTTRARWVLRRYSRSLLTPIVRDLWMHIDGETIEEQRLLSARRDLWWEHYRRYCTRHHLTAFAAP